MLQKSLQKVDVVNAKRLEKGKSFRKFGPCSTIKLIVAHSVLCDSSLSRWTGSNYKLTRANLRHRIRRVGKLINLNET